MVKSAAQIILFAALAATPACLFAADSPKAPSLYRVGETAKEDVVTPVPLMVVDPDATEVLRQQEAPRIPVIYRFNPKTADEVEVAFRTAVAETRAKFLDALEKQFNVRKLDAATITAAPFQDLAARFLSENANLPANPQLLAAWAKEEADDAILNPLTGRLRDAMSRYIRPEGLPAGIKSSARARIVTGAPGEGLTLDVIEKQHDDVARGNMPTLAKVRADLIASFPAEEQATGKFLAGFLTENCQADADLTRLSRDKRTESIVSLNNYEAGQQIVKKGQVITAKTRAALNQLIEKSRMGQLQQQVAESQTQTRIFGEKSRWLLVGLGAVVVVAGLAIWRVTAMRRRPAPAHNHSNLPMKILGAESDGMVISCPTCREHIVVPFDGEESAEMTAGCDHDSPEHWKQRALMAERRAEQAAAMVRAGMLSQMAQHLTTDVVKKLIGQRNQLAAEQNAAAQGMQGMEERLEKTEGNWQRQRQEYEVRIAALEKDLSESTELNRALIKTKIAIARRQLASADAAHKHTRWN